MHCKLIVLFLFFECTVFYAATKRIHHDKIVASQRNQLDVAEFVLVNPKQIQHAENVIKHFLTRIIGPIAQPIILKSSFLKGGNLQETISEICKIIRGKIMEFAQASGLTTSDHQYEQTPENLKISNDWFTESIIQESLLLRDLVKVGEEIRFRINRYLKKYNITLYMDEKFSSHKATESFKFLNTINKAVEFNERLFNCLQSVKIEKDSLSFDLIQIFANLTKDSPNITVKSFKSSLNQAFSYSIPNNGTNDKQLYVLLCYSLVERASHYGDCIKELRRLAACMSLPRQDSNGVITNTFPSWLTDTGYLSGCQIDVANKNININCNRKLPRTTVQQVKYIYENILNRRISERSSLHRVANELGNVLSKSTWGRQLTYDVCQCFVIYEEGRKKLNALSKNATKNKKVVIRLKKLAASLKMYKNEILKKMMLTIGNFHRSALEMQKFLTRVIKVSFKESWQNHIKILNYLFEWIKKLLELFEGTSSDDTDVNVTPQTTTDVDVSITTTDADVSITTDISPSFTVTDLTTITPNDFNDNFYIKNNQYLVVHRKKNQIKKETDAAFEKLLKSMNYMNKVQSRSSNSTVAHIANNLLLIVIFMETLSFASTLFSLGKYKDETNSEASTEEWDSSERERRSLFSTDFITTDIIKNDSLHKASQKITNIYNKENINYTRNKSADKTNNFYSYFYSLKKGYSKDKKQ